MAIDFNIEDIFDGVPEDQIPNNRPKMPVHEALHLIIAGGTSYNYFIVLFPYSEAISEITVTYKQLDKVSIVKYPNYIDKQENQFVIQVVLSPEESALFADSLLDTLAQVKIKYLDDSIYTDTFTMKVVDTLQEALRQKWI